ncbi:MAG: hypothetical protein U0175_29145 [Caldilineaceae bacterium]
MTTKSSVQSLQRPKWWLVSALIPLMGGMLFVEHRLRMSAFWHQFFGVAMILLVYGLMGFWLWLNSDYFASQPAPNTIFGEFDEPLFYSPEDEAAYEEAVANEEIEWQALEQIYDQDTAETINELEEALALEYTLRTVAN